MNWQPQEEQGPGGEPEQWLPEDLRDADRRVNERTPEDADAWRPEGIQLVAPAPAESPEAWEAPEGPRGADAGHETVIAENQAQAAEAYCREVSGSSVLARAMTAQALANALEGADQIQDDRLLRTARVVAAEQVPATRPDPGWTAPHGEPPPASHDPECASTPMRLAERANEEIGEEDLARLEEHLNACLLCRALELRVARAERVFTACLIQPKGRPSSGSTLPR